MKIKKCVIPVAGLGTRFLPASKALPKEMFPVIDKPIMQYVVEEAVSAGCEDIVVITGRNKRAIEDHFDSNFELETALLEKGKLENLEEVKRLATMANIVYIRQPYPRGDGDAILKAKSMIGDEPFLVLFGDDLIDGLESGACQLTNKFEEKNTPIIGTFEVPKKDVGSYGVLETDENDKVTRFLEKPNPKDTNSRNCSVGKYLLTPEIFSYLEKVKKQKPKSEEIRLADAFALMLEDGKDIHMHSFEGERFDAGSKLGFLEATVAMALKRDDIKDDFRKILEKRLKD